VALDNFIPEIWSARLLQHLDKNLVFKRFVNTDYEGEIESFGDTVRINQIGDVTVGDYTKNGTISAPQALDSSQLTLVIDQAKYFNFYVDDIDKAQQKPKVMDAAMGRAAYALANTVDTYIAGLYSDAGIAIDKDGEGTALAVGDTSNGADVSAYDLIVNIATELDTKNVPKTGRWLVLPPWMFGLLLKDSRFTQFQDYMTSGRVPVVAGISLFESNNIQSSLVDPDTNPESGDEYTEYYLMAGTNMAISFAQQINSVEAYRPEDRFADAVKGLLLYGAKVVIPDALAKIIVKQ